MRIWLGLVLFGENTPGSRKKPHGLNPYNPSKVELQSIRNHRKLNPKRPPYQKRCYSMENPFRLHSHQRVAGAAQMFPHPLSVLCLDFKLFGHRGRSWMHGMLLVSSFDRHFLHTPVVRQFSEKKALRF